MQLFIAKIGAHDVQSWEWPGSAKRYSFLSRNAILMQSGHGLGPRVGRGRFYARQPSRNIICPITLYLYMHTLQVQVEVQNQESSSFATVLHAPRRTQAHENVLSYDFQVSGSESASEFCCIDPDCDTDSDPEIFWYQFLFSEQKLIRIYSPSAFPQSQFLILRQILIETPHY
jgi:hypothetical protein